MSIVNINIPDDGWFSMNCNTLPLDKQLCVIIHRYGNQSPEIYQYRKADWLHKESDYFLDVSERWRLESIGGEEEWEPSFATHGIIKYWKPLGLPVNENERLQLEIERWFEDDDT